jgi:hypothetical protein
MPMWPNTGGSLAEAASGGDNAQWAALAKNLIAGGLGTAILRIGWEFNGSWYPWSVLNATDAAAFAQAWRQIVGTVQRVPGQHFGFDWSMTASAGGVNPALAYPGNSYVTTVGMDVYDWNQTGGSTPAQRWHGCCADPWRRLRLSIRDNEVGLFGPESTFVTRLFGVPRRTMAI